jgi:putative ABC transport system permease protein
MVEAELSNSGRSASNPAEVCHVKPWVIACRSLARRPAFAVIAVLTLAFGIGTTTAIFSVVDTVLIKPLPFPHADRLLSVMEANPAKAQSLSLVAPGRLEDWNGANRAFEAFSGIYSENVTDTGGAEPERLEGRRVAPRYFAVYGMAALAGRTFTPEEERFGGPTVAVISEGLWTRRYGRDPAALSRRLVLGGIGYSIVGVMPAAFTSAPIDVWLPAQFAPGLVRVREARFLSGVGRMKPGVSIEQATADLVRVQQALGEQYPASDKGWSVSVADLKTLRVGEYRRALALVFAAVALLLVIAVANIAGLMLVQLRRRARELSIRQAVGGSRIQIIGALLREVLVLAAAGALAGAAAASWLVGLFAKLFATVPRMNELALDWRALTFTAATSGLAALVFGLWPALHVTQSDLAPMLAEGGRGVSAGRHRLQQALVVSQIALSILLTASAGLMLRSYYNLSHVDAGFSSERAITFHVGAAWDEDRARVGHMQERILADLQQVPNVVAAGFTNFLPATGATLRYQVVLEGVATSEDRGKITVGERTVSSGYLQALAVPLIAGAWCPPLRFDPNAQPKAMVNRAFAERYGPNLVGRHFTFDQMGGAHEIVGVVGDLIEDGAGAAPAPYVYACSSAGSWPDPEYVIRTQGDVRAVMSAVRQIVHGIDPNRAIFGMKTVDEVLAGALDQPRLNAGIITLFAAAAMALASLGLHSLLMLLVSERSRELGVRIALGAAPLQVVGLVVSGAARLLACGVAAGLVLTIAAARVLQAVLFGVTALDGPTLATAVLVLTAVALTATALPARRAGAIDPIEAMRTE